MKDLGTNSSALTAPSNGEQAAEQGQCKATDPIALERLIMDSNRAKSEHEWWAAHEIERLREAIKAARDQTLMAQHSQETRLNDIYDILHAAIAKATGAA